MYKMGIYGIIVGLNQSNNLCLDKAPIWYLVSGTWYLVQEENCTTRLVNDDALVLLIEAMRLSIERDACCWSLSSSLQYQIHNYLFVKC